MATEMVDTAAWDVFCNIDTALEACEVNRSNE